MQFRIISKDSNAWLADLFWLTLLLLALYTVWLGSYPLFTPDEGRYSEVAREMVTSGDYITPRIDGVAFLDKPVLYYWLQASAILLFGVKEWALRLFPALFGVLGVLVTYGCTRILFNRRTGIVAALILATTPLYFGSAHYANLDLEVGILISCALLFFITAIHSAPRYQTYFLVAAYVAAGLAALTKGMIGIVFPTMIIGSWIVMLWRWRLLKSMLIIPGLLIFSCIVLPWYYLVQQANPAFLHYFFVTQQVTRFLSHGTFNNVVPIWFYFPVVLGGFFPWTIFFIPALIQTIKNCWKQRAAHDIELFLLLWVGIVFTFFSIPHSKAVTYILPIFPPLAILTGKFLAQCWEASNQKNVAWLKVIYSSICLILAASFVAIPFLHINKIIESLTPYLFAEGTIFLSAAIITLANFRKQSLASLFSVCTSANIAFLIVLVLGVNLINLDTAKPLANKLQAIIKPQDEVIAYYRYYQDVPLYLGKRITIVEDWDSPKIPENDNWARELWYGMAFQKTDWLIKEDAFWKRWNSNKRVFVFLNANYFSQFQAHTKNYFQLGRANDIYLLSNQPTVDEIR